MKTERINEYVTYIETPRHCDAPVKIDEILEARMRAFLKTRRVRQLGIMVR